MELTWLDLSWAKVEGDGGLAALGRLPHLTTLTLRETKVTDEVMKNLTALKNLTSLILSSTQVTDAGVKELRKALPQCDVVK